MTEAVFPFLVSLSQGNIFSKRRGGKRGVTLSEVPFLAVTMALPVCAYENV